MVTDGFDIYFKTYIIPLKEQYPNVPLHIIGTVAAGFHEYLHQAAHNNNLKVSSVIKEPKIQPTLKVLFKQKLIMNHVSCLY